MIADYVTASPPKTSAEIYRDNNGSWSVKVDFKNEPLPEELSAVFGDLIHNLRTSLDLAACECVRNNNKSDKGVLFPFCDNASDLDLVIKQRNIKRAQKEVVEYIKCLLPFKGGNIALRAIHDLDIRDKHRAMVPQALSFASPVIQIREQDGTLCDPPRIVGDPNMASDIRFVFPEDTPLAKEELIPTLHHLITLVDSIVSALSCILDATHVS